MRASGAQRGCCGFTTTLDVRFQKTDPEGKHHLPSQRHRVLQGIQELLLRAFQVCGERVRRRHHPKHAGSGRMLLPLALYLIYQQQFAVVSLPVCVFRAPR